MKTNSLESKFIDKLNRVLHQTSVRICFNTHNKLVSLNVNGTSMGLWQNPRQMFFENGADAFNVFERFRRDFAYDDLARQTFEDLGLTCLENCSSLEEVLLKLDVMFPDV